METCDKHGEFSVGLARLETKLDMTMDKTEAIDGKLDMSLGIFNTHVVESVSHREQIAHNKASLDAVTKSITDMSKLLVIIIIFIVAMHGVEFLSMAKGLI